MEWLDKLNDMDLTGDVNDVYRTIAAFNPMDVVRIMVIAAAIWLIVKIAQKVIKVAAAIVIAIIIVTRFL